MHFRCCCGVCVRIDLNSELFEMFKMNAGACACCVRPYVRFGLDDVTMFSVDHGLASSSLMSVKHTV